MFKSLLAGSVAVPAVCLLGIAVAGPAQAATGTWSDPRDTGHGSDLRAVRVVNDSDELKVVTRHVNLRRDPSTGTGGAVFLDTDRSDRGPEYVVVGGYFDGTDYALIETEGFATRNWGDHVEGPFDLRIRYRADKVVTRIPASTLGLDEGDAVRVAVRVSGTRRDGTSRGLRDWLGDPREFTEWVGQG